MSILNLPHAVPKVLLFDWHATPVDTHAAMYLNRARPSIDDAKHIAHREFHHTYKPDALVNNSLELLDMVRKFFPG